MRGSWGGSPEGYAWDPASLAHLSAEWNRLPDRMSIGGRASPRDVIDEQVPLSGTAHSRPIRTRNVVRFHLCATAAPCGRGSRGSRAPAPSAQSLVNDPDRGFPTDIV